MRGIVNVLLLLISLTGPIAVAMLVLGSDRGRRRRNVLIGIATVAAATFTLATYVEVSGLPPSGVGSEAGPQDAPGFAIANAFLAGLVYLLVWAICKGIESLRPIASSRATSSAEASDDEPREEAIGRKDRSQALKRPQRETDVAISARKTDDAIRDTSRRRCAAAFRSDWSFE